MRNWITYDFKCENCGQMWANVLVRSGGVMQKCPMCNSEVTGQEAPDSNTKPSNMTANA